MQVPSPDGLRLDAEDNAEGVAAAAGPAVSGPGLNVGPIAFRIGPADDEKAVIAKTRVVPGASANSEAESSLTPIFQSVCPPATCGWAAKVTAVNAVAARKNVNDKKRDAGDRALISASFDFSEAPGGLALSDSKRADARGESLPRTHKRNAIS